MALHPDVRPVVEARLSYLREWGSDLVLDGDVHPTERTLLPPEIARRTSEDPNYFHGRPLLADELIATMDRAGVDMALCWQNPATLTYTDNQDENYQRLLAANLAISKLAATYPTRVIPGGWTDPKAIGLEHAIALARRCIEELGMPVVKMNPAQNAYQINDPMVLAVVDEIVARGAVPAFHFGSDSPFTPPSGMRAVAERHPDHPVIGVHMGGGGGHFVEAEPIYQGARQLGLDCPNIVFILSAIRDTHIDSALITYAAAGEPWSRNLVAGSDAPYGNMVWNFGGFRSLLAALRDGKGFADPRLSETPDLFDDRLIANILGGNLARLVAEADDRILGAGLHGATAP